MAEQAQPTRAELQAAFDAALDALKPQLRRFVLEYLKDFRGRDAAIRAGYSEKTAHVQASQHLRKLKIQEAIACGVDLAAMPKTEVLSRMSAIARGSMQDLLRIERVTHHPRFSVKAPTAEDPNAVEWLYDPIGEERLQVSLDLEQARDRGVLHLVKKFKDGQNGIEVELYSAADALIQLGKYYKLFVDRTELTGADGGPIKLHTFEQALERAYGEDNDQPEPAEPDGDRPASV